jgi:hypothetical protein
MILYDYDTNAIFAEPLQNRRAASILTAYKTLHARLCAAGFRPKLQRLDNECSNLLKAFMTAEKVDSSKADSSPNYDYSKIRSRTRNCNG